MKTAETKTEEPPAPSTKVPPLRRSPTWNRRFPLEQLKALSELFEKHNPYRLGAVEIAKRAGVPHRSVRELLLVHSKRPDLVAAFFRDEISLHQAGREMRAEPEKWSTEPLSRLTEPVKSKWRRKD
jgi:hypothetical protein